MKIERFTAAACLLALAGCSPPKPGPAPRKSLRIAVIPKGSTHEFWRVIHAGALKAKEELDEAGTPVEIIWKGPIREDDREQQIQVVEGFASQGVDGMVLAPLDDKALVRPVEEAKKLGVPTVIIDSNLATDEIVSFVARTTKRGEPSPPRSSAASSPGRGRRSSSATRRARRAPPTARRASSRR